MAFRSLRDSWCPHADHHPAWGQRTAVGRAAKRMKAEGHTGRDIAKYLGVSRATLYRYPDEGDAAYRHGLPAL